MQKQLNGIGSYAAVQSFSEIGLGSVVHALHVPFGGHLLSLNQGLILTRAVRGLGSRRRAIETAAGISSVSAILKALSPAGKRVPPMVAICVQGIFYALGIGIAGLNVFGVLLAMCLLSLWAFLQPLLMAYVFFGGTLFQAVQKLWIEGARYFEIDQSWGLWILAGIVGFKLLFSVGVGLLAWNATLELEQKYLNLVTRLWKSARMQTSSPQTHPPVVGALKDLVNPWFLISLGMSIGFIVLSGTQTPSEIWFYALKAIAMAGLVFWVLRAVPLDRWNGWLKHFPAVQAALKSLRADRGDGPTQPEV